MKIINRTHHPIHLYKDGQVVKSFDPVAPQLRLNFQRIPQAEAVNDMPIEVVKIKPKSIEPIKPGRVFIVSDDYRKFYPWRPDLISPADLVRNGHKVIGCRKFFANPGYKDWLEKIASKAAIIHSNSDLLAITSILQKDVLVFNVMDANSQEVQGAVNIPPGKNQSRYLDQVIPKDIQVVTIGSNS